MNTPAILRVRYYGDSYIAVDTANGVRKVSSTAGSSAAAIAWAAKYESKIRASEIREATDEELAGVNRTKDKPEQRVTYWTWSDRTPQGPKVITVSLEQLEAHPALARVALVPAVAEALHANARSHKDRLERANEVTADWAAWVEEIRQQGVREPLRVVRRPVGTAPCSPLPGYWIVEGRHRFAAALESGKSTVPVIEVDDDELMPLAIGTVTGRRHWTKSQRAFFAVITFPQVAGEDRKAGRPSKSRTECGIKNEDLAARFGVSLRLIELAIELYRGLDQYPAFRDRIEPGLWGGTGLQECLNGLNALIGGTTGPGITHPKIPTARFASAWRHESAAAAKWAALGEDQRTVLTADLTAAAKDLPADYLDWKLEVLADVLAEKRKAEAEAASVPAPLSEA